jgi:hypothetical protein
MGKERKGGGRICRFRTGGMLIYIYTQERKRRRAQTTNRRREKEDVGGEG